MLAAGSAAAGEQSVQAQATVAVVQVDGGYQLTRNGEPYRIRGVGGDSHLADLVDAGANSIRTWGAEQLEKTLDEAHRHGLTVCAGLWVAHERHGFDYSDGAAVRKQHEELVAAVRRYKDHPAILLWGVGNEMEGDGNNPAVWQAVNAIARDIKRIDPAHPTMTVIAELGENENKLKNLHRFCSDIDIVGVNSYGGIPTLAARYKKSGVARPYIVTEHGPVGPWETEKTAWGSPVEATSTAKGKAYASGYRAAVTEQPALCLGSYAFLWGHKQETTATWFGMLLADGTRLAAVDAMTTAWTGSPPANRCPQIESLRVDRTNNLKPGDKIKASVSTADPEGDELIIKWVLRSDSGTVGVGGDAQDQESTIGKSVLAEGQQAVVTVPERDGAYRLFAYVYDGNGGGAVANVPISVGSAGTASAMAAPRARLPFVVYGDGADQTVYVPSGYMGNAGAVSMKADSTNRPHSGRTCLKVDYRSTADWGGVLWQSPANDWDGSKPGGADLSGAAQLEFWARGSQGGETVNFVFGVIDGQQPFRDTARGELKDVKLTTEWNRYTMPLNGNDLSRIKTGFGWSLAAQGKPVTFYLDDIRYVAAE